MKIYILSDDSFFSLGLTTVLAKAGYETFLLDPGAGAACLDSCYGSAGIVIVDIDERERLNSILHKGLPEEMRLVFVTNYHGRRENEQSYFDIFMPRKITCKHVAGWLSRYHRQKVRNYCQLSECEKIILYLLLNGESPGSIAEKMNISVKKISKHKVSALNKLGIRKMNSKSLLYISDYIYKTVCLSLTYNESLGSYSR